MADWRPQGKTIALLDHVRQVLDEYADFLPLAVRVIFYRLVGIGVLDKSERVQALRTSRSAAHR